MESLILAVATSDPPPQYTTGQWIFGISIIVVPFLLGVASSMVERHRQKSPK